MVSVELPSLKANLDAPHDVSSGGHTGTASGSLSEPVSCGSSMKDCPGGSAEVKASSSFSLHSSHSSVSSDPSSNSAAPNKSPDVASFAAAAQYSFLDPIRWVQITDDADDAASNDMNGVVSDDLFDSFLSSLAASDMSLSNPLRDSRKYKVESLNDFISLLYILSSNQIQLPLSKLHSILTGSDQASEEWLDFYNNFLSPMPSDFLIFVFWFPRRWPRRFRISEDPVLMRIREVLTRTRVSFNEGINLDSLLYEHGDWSIDGECAVCFGQYGGLTRLCCGRVVCESCRQQYFITLIDEGRTSIACPACPKAVSRAEVFEHLPQATKEKMSRFLVDANKDPNRKTCPNCCAITERPVHNLTKKQLKRGLNLTCEHCSLEWCFNCQAPKHTGLSCKKFAAGDTLLLQWAKHEHTPGVDPKLGNRNARRCPGCKVFIHRYDGCPEMRCSQCGKIFCYACGQPMRRLMVIGNHSNRLSVLGCRKRLFPRNAPLRWFVRGSLLSFGVLMTPAIVGGVVVAAVVMLPLAGVRFLLRRWHLRNTLHPPIPLNLEDWSWDREVELEPHVHSEDHLTRL